MASLREKCGKTGGLALPLGLVFGLALGLAWLAPSPAARADAMYGATDTFTLTHTWEGNQEFQACGICGFPLEGLCLCPPASTLQGVSTQLGGPLGLLDTYLQLSALPSFGVETWNVASNRTGDYNAAGIGGISLSVRNYGGSPLQVRVGVERGPTRWVTSNAAAATVPVASGWTTADFALTEPAMTRVAGTDPLSWVLDRVEEVRIFHSAAAQWSGDSGSTLGIDNVVLPEPGLAPALAAGAALLAGLGARRRSARRSRR